MEKYINIALPVPVNELFTYSIPENLYSDKLIGIRVIVPFGRKKLTGVIIENIHSSNYKNTKEILELLDERPVFSENMIKLAKWISEYYLSPIGETLRAMLPSGMTAETTIRLRSLRIPNNQELNEIKKRAPVKYQILQALNNHKDFVSLKIIQKKINVNISRSQLEWLEKKGFIQLKENLSKLSDTKTLKAVKITETYFKDENKLSEEIQKIEKRSIKAAKVISEVFINQSESKISFVNQLCAQFEYNYASIKNLAKREIFKIYDQEINTNSVEANSLSKRNEALLKLTDEQNSAKNKLIESLNLNIFKVFLLHGITGSGKTLVYIQAILHAIKIGKKAILMVPEISLTPQLIDRFRNTFGDRIAILHSHLSKQNRYDSWKMIKDGKADLVIGARSALFAPIDDLGLIIVDEEHEGSYKQDSPSPRYNARDSAIIRAKIENCTVLLGSATPSMESMYNAKIGKYELLEIKSRADGAKLPDIQTIDLLNADKNGKLIGSFSSNLLNAVSNSLNNKEGIILLQNRRGFADLLQCKSCGETPKCKNCDVSLTYHKFDESLKCHYCGYTTLTDKCKYCGSDDLRLLGSGTQRIEDEIKQYIDSIDINIERFDLDTTSNKGAHRKILSNFASGKTNILVGTQMVAKGIDFDHVTLVGILNADLQLKIPDFRSNEKTFQLLTQVSGRAGRSGLKSGKVVLQTSQPEDKTIQAVINKDFDTFYQNELELRKETLYPPYTRFCRIEFSDKNEPKIHNVALYFFRNFPEHKSLIIYNPSEPFIKKINNYHRKFIIIKNLKEYDPNGKILRKAISDTISVVKKHPGFSIIRISIDIDSNSSF